MEDPIANRYRGEVVARLDGRAYRLRLTLGALAELETVLDGRSFLAVAEHFEEGELKAGEIVAILGAGLRGGGAAVTNEEVAQMTVEGGAFGYVAIVAHLIAATFGLPDPNDKMGTDND